MHPKSMFFRWRGVGALAAPLVVLGLAASCDSPSSPDDTSRDPSVRAAKGGGNSIVVSSVNPPSADPGVTLDLSVFGSGFPPGSSVSFKFDGKPAKKLVTNSTKFESSTELTANVTIESDADLGLYDVVVRSGPSKGVGTELFEVGVTPTALVDDDPQYKVRSDGRGSPQANLYVRHDPDGTAGEECVNVPEGEFGLRTIRGASTPEIDPLCNAVTRTGDPPAAGAWRFLTFDLGPGNVGTDPVAHKCGATKFDLDQDGDCEAIEKAPARFVFQTSGKGTKGQAKVVIWVLELNDDPNSTTTHDALWTFRYQTLVPKGSPPGVVTLGPGDLDGDGTPDAAADLCYQPDAPSGNQACPISATIDMPFHITWDVLIGG